MKSYIKIFLFLLCSGSVFASSLEKYSTRILCQDSSGRVLNIGLNPLTAEAYFYYENSNSEKIVKYLGDIISYNSHAVVELKSEYRGQLRDERIISFNAMSAETFRVTNFASFEGSLERAADNSINKLELKFTSGIKELPEAPRTVDIVFGPQECVFN